MKWDILLRLKNNLTKDYLTLVAAGIGFYFLLATFPAIAAVISIYGLFADPNNITNLIQQLSTFVPEDMLRIVSSQAEKIAAESGKTLSLNLTASILLTIYGTSKGMKALIKGINMAYHQDQRRKLLSLNLVSMTLTVLMVVYFIVSLTVVAGLPAMLNMIEIPQDIASRLLILRWPVLFMLAIPGLEILYYYGPSGKNRRFKWISYGSITASVLWMAGSALFSTFMSNFYDFNKIYGSLGVGIALLFWFWLSALTILVGAEINATVEGYFKDKQTEERNKA
jgi:membrane protein